MARLSPSSNISYPTTPDPPRRQQDEDEDEGDDDNNNNNDNDDDDDNEHDVPGQRISSPDYVEVEIPQSIGGVAPSQQSPASTSSEGYPSWLPKRPPPPAPGSTLHSLSTAMMFGSDGPAEQQQQHSGGAGGGEGLGPPASGASEGERLQQQTPVPFSGGRKTHTTFRAHRQHAGLECRHLRHRRRRWWSSGRAAGDRSDDDDAGKQYCRCHHHSPPLVPLHPSSAPLYGPVVVVLLRKRLRLVDSRQRHFFLLPRHRMLACVPLSRHRQSSDLRAYTSNSCAIRPSKRAYIFIYGLSSFSHMCPFRRFFDFNAVYILIEVAKFPNPDSPGVPGSGHNWVLGAVAYIACWILWIFGVFLGYEVLYSYYRRWRFRRPLILPIYMSSPAFNFVAMSSYDHFCFLQHIRSSTFPYVNSSAVLPSAEGSLRDALAETCNFYAQNLPTIVTLLPRAGLAQVLLLSFFSPVNFPGELSLSGVDQSIGSRDGTFFDKNRSSVSLC